MLPSQTPAHALELQAPATRVSHSIGTRPVQQYVWRDVSGSGHSATLRAHPEYGTLGGMSMTRTAPTSYRNFINGQWVDASASGTLENRNPANQDDVVGVLPRSTPEDVSAAVAAARDAFARWRLVPAPRAPVSRR